MKFKVGDKVKVIPVDIDSSKNGRLLVGREGIVTTTYSSCVTLDIEPIPNTGIHNYELELVQPAAQTQSPPSSIAAALKPLYQPLYIDNFCGMSKWIDDKLSGNMFNKKCECGSHSVGVDRHSDYCPLYTKS